MSLWWERLPHVLRRELQAFDDAGIEIEIDEDAQKNGLMKIELMVEVKGKRLELSACYPDLFPYFRPSVVADSLELERHLHPFGKEICLLPRSTHFWDPEEPLASVLVEQLPKVFEANETTDQERIVELEGRVPEPAADFYSGRFFSNSYILIDSAWELDETAKAGDFDLHFSLKPSEYNLPEVQGVITEIRDDRGTVIAKWAGSIPSAFEFSGTFRWVRLEKHEWTKNGVELRKTLIEKAGLPDKLKKRKFGKWKLELTGVVFPDEVTHRASGDGWMFTLGGQKALSKKDDQCWFIRPLRGGEIDMGIRVPARSSLKDKCIAIFGIGAVGAPLVLELAKNGARELHLFDHDTVEPGQSVRWPLGLEAYGSSKLDSLEKFIRANYPDVDVFPYPNRVGELRFKHTDGRVLPETSQVELLRDVIENVDLVVDTTAEVAVTHVLSDFCRENKTLFVCAYGYPGAWGGVVAHFSPGSDTGCWVCMRHAMFEAHTIPEPPFDKETEDGVQPIGCSEPTFVGASFDLTEISLEAARTVAGILSSDGGYPATPWDVAILSLRDEAGNRIPPAWKSYPIPKWAGCSCSKKSS
jgi:molybdopterin/thiamine biosynthesis adenylyltransferase